MSFLELTSYDIIILSNGLSVQQSLHSSSLVSALISCGEISLVYLPFDPLDTKVIKNSWVKSQQMNSMLIFHEEQMSEMFKMLDTIYYFHYTSIITGHCIF